ncbi:pilus assembly protein PilO [Hydrogenophaga crassostreae]|uniref:Pilus assembly protein PilO n=1 Tax=Hydrogenophaga crassostreae TaxID=1763535 RepID=A0A162YXT7_9BURK|nr:type 4a pilus biogenesis protein PilO [Hydrogenophaga crassostreae]AOW12122.1 pilus assembly protein PilO [Hydrogenophaga crassostreae]OAD41067.1 pilus assembly protein PilO [Hydrogenophaga crassostreae]
MALSPAMDVDLKRVGDGIKRQFTGLDANNPASWPSLPKNLLYLALCIAVVAGLWWFWLSSVNEQLIAEQNTEQKLRDEYRGKLVQAVNLEALKKQLVQVQQYVSQLEKQLPSKAEMDALLSDINQAGLGRSLQFELFRPGNVSVKEYYAELPIAVRVTGGYHDIGLFAADIANLSRIVTLNNISLEPTRDRDGILTMNCTAKTFRYLDQEEIAQQQETTVGKGKKGAKK